MYHMRVEHYILKKKKENGAQFGIKGAYSLSLWAEKNTPNKANFDVILNYNYMFLIFNQHFSAIAKMNKSLLQNFQNKFFP